MKRSISPVLMAGTAVALVLLVINMTFAVVNVRQMRQAAVRVQHSHNVLTALQSTLSLARDAETAQHGYVVTGQAVYLGPYRDAVRATRREVARLDALLRDEPEAQANIKDVRGRVDARLGALDSSIAQRSLSEPAPSESTLLSERRLATEALRRAGATLEASEQARLARRESDEAESYRNALAAGFVTGLAALLGILAFVVLTQRSLLARGRSEAALAAETEKLRITLGSIADAVITTGTEGRITGMNAVAESLTGWHRDEALGQELDAVFRIVDEKTRQPITSPLQRVLQGGDVLSLADRTLLLARDGAERQIGDSVAPIRTAEGSVAGVVVVFRDVSGRRRSEKALREAEARLRRVVMQMAVPTMAYSDDDRVLLVNDAWVNGTGYSRSELTTLTAWAQRAYPKRAGFMQKHIASMFGLTERVDSGERELTTASGDKRIWHFFTAPIGRDPAGRRILVTNAIDVTERRAIEERLQDTDSRLRFALDAAGVGQWEFDAAGISLSRSLRHDRLFGYDELQPEWSFARFLEHVVDDDRARVDTAFREAMDHVGVLDVECRIRRRDGALRHLWLRASAHRDAEGALRMVGLVGDMTREKAAIDALKKAGLGVAAVPRIVSAAASATGGAVAVGSATTPGSRNSAAAATGLRILVVEDNDDSAEAMLMLLELTGHEPHVARNGTEALALAESLRPQAVLLDIGLPDMNGYEVCRRLRELPWSERPIVIAVTGWAQEQDSARSRRAGFDGHLVKPVGLDELAAALATAR
ncbi:MAG: PAS domain S-box protein [Caldimonas sp.]